MSLAAFRRSRIYTHETSSACRCPFRSLEPTHCRSLAVESLCQSSVPTDSYGVVVSDGLRQVEVCTAGNLDSTLAGFTMRTGRGTSNVLHIFKRLRCRVRGQVLVVQEHQPLPAEPCWHLSAHTALQESLRRFLSMENMPVLIV
jgi:hypothetical protein